jgi:hypothetical protein
MCRPTPTIAATASPTISPATSPTTGGQTFTYDVTGQQATAAYSGYSLSQNYDGDTLRVKRFENGVTSYFLRSSAFGGQIVAEIDGAGNYFRGYVYDGGGKLLAVQRDNTVYWVQQNP